MTWVWWTVIGVVLFALVLMVLVCMPLLRRLRPLGRAVRRLEARAQDAQALQPQVESLRLSAETLQKLMAQAQERTAARRSAGSHRG